LRSIDGRKILVRDGVSLEERNPMWESPPVSIEPRVWRPASDQKKEETMPVLIHEAGEQTAAY